MNVLTPSDKIPDDLGPSIFLVGPTPRSKDVGSWRKLALSVLEGINFEGTVLIPEVLDAEEWNPVYAEQIEWEWKGLQSSTVVAAWVPRKIDEGMPAFTTNVEFGMLLSDSRLIYGRPDWAEKCRYLDYVYKKVAREEPVNDLRRLMRLAKQRAEYFWENQND